MLQLDTLTDTFTQTLAETACRVCASSGRRRQNAFGSCATDLRLIRYGYFG